MEDDLRWKTTFNGRRVLIGRFQDSALPYTTVAVIFIKKLLCISFQLEETSRYSYFENYLYQQLAKEESTALRGNLARQEYLVTSSINDNK